MNTIAGMDQPTAKVQCRMQPYDGCLSIINPDSGLDCYRVPWPFVELPCNG